MKENRKEDSKNLETALYFGLALYGLHLYIELHTFFSNYGYAHPITDKILGNLVDKNGLFHGHWWLKLVAGGFIIGYGVANRGVKSLTLTNRSVVKSLLVGLVLYCGSTCMLSSDWLLSMTGINEVSIAYMVATALGLLYLLKGAQWFNRLLEFIPGADTFNEKNETFPQEQQLIENEDSVNLPTVFEYQGKNHDGWLNIANPYQSVMTLGKPGSGKSYAIMNPVIRQHIAKGFSMYVYDWKFPSLSLVAFNAMLRHKKNLPKNLRYYCINFDNPAVSHRCNPLHPDYMPDVSDAYETAKIMMLNMNKTWIGKEGDIWAESAINYTTALLWFLRCYKGGIYCTLPHLVELMMIDYRKLFPILMANPDLEAYMTLFVSAYNDGAMEMLAGQVGTARSGLSKLSSPSIYWVMSANDFMLDINNPDAPKILCLGNNNKKKNINGIAIGLLNGRILNQINQPGQHRCSVVIDELPTLYFQGLSDLIATGRSNDIAVALSMQDFSQLEREYGKPEAEAIKNTLGTIIAGKVTGQTAKSMEELLGKNVQRKQTLNIQTDDTTHGITTELAPMVPAAKFGRMKTGQFAGVVTGVHGKEGDLKAFNANIIIDEKDFKAEQKVKKLPDFSIFANKGTSIDEVIKENFYLIKLETKKIVEDETARLGQALNVTPKNTGKKHGRTH